MANPFFSGRIPEDLNNRINQYCQETGESKTHLLIKALSAYLQHPINLPNNSNAGSVSIEAFNQLEQRVSELEKLLKTGIIKGDNKVSSEDISNDNKHDNELVGIDNSSITGDTNDNSESHERQVQLSVLEDDSSKRSNEWIVPTIEVPNLIGIKDKGIHRDIFLTKLRNARKSKSQSIKTGTYTITFYGKEPGAKGSLLWKVTKE